MPSQPSNKPRKRGIKTSTTKEPVLRVLKPYDQRPYPLKGDKRVATTYQAVGEALTHWERFEGAMSLLFSHLMSSTMYTNTLPARRAYNSVRTFEGRHSMVQAAQEAYFDSNQNAELQAEVKSTLREAFQLCARRNEIAHGMIGIHQKQDNVNFPLSKLTDLGYTLKPSFANTQHKDLQDRPKFAYSSKELSYYTKEFIRLFVSTFQLITKMQSDKRAIHQKQLHQKLTDTR